MIQIRSGRDRDAHGVELVADDQADLRLLQGSPEHTVVATRERVDRTVVVDALRKVREEIGGLLDVQELASGVDLDVDVAHCSVVVLGVSGELDLGLGVDGQRCLHIVGI